MAKHARPTAVSTLRKVGARTGAALALTTVGVLGASPMAMAGEESDHYEGDIEESQQAGLINVEDSDAQVPVEVCNNNVPVNVLGIQVPVQDIAGAAGLSGSQGANSGDSCGQASSQDEDN